MLSCAPARTCRELSPGPNMHAALRAGPPISGRAVRGSPPTPNYCTKKFLLLLPLSLSLSLSALQDLHFQPCILRAAKRRLSLHTWKPLGCGRTTQNRRQLSAARAAGALARGWLFVLGGALAHAHLHKRKERKYKNKDIKMSENMHAAPFWVRQILGEKREDSLRIV